ncbi:MAG: anti-sigma factor family protein [Limisphaerales bacterium]
MNTELKLQALVDGELDAREVREVEALLARDAQCAALAQELKWTKGALLGNDAALALPETREFFWSKVERSIAFKEENAAVAAPAERTWWLKLLYPATALAAMVAVVFVISGGRPTDGADSENVPEDLNAVSFRSESEKMSVVYVADENGNFSPVSEEVKNAPEADK